jgi:nucleoside-diphosphate-sugar epimerase
MAGRSVILIGATGLVGSKVLQRLLKDPGVAKICAPTRRPIGVEDPKLSNPTFSFDEFELHADQLSEAEDLYFCYGTTLKNAGSKTAFVRVELDQSEKMIKVCLRKGVKRLFMVSSSNANPSSVIFYSKIKGQLEEFAKELVKQQKLTELVILRPSLLLGDRAESRPIEAFFRAVLKPLLFAFVGPLKASKPVWDWQVASTLVKSAKVTPGKEIRTIQNEVICDETA